MSIALTSDAIQEGQPIPDRFTGDGEDVSPPLVWSGLPEGTQELALVVDDPDAPTPQPWVHWLIYKIPAGETGLPAAVATSATLAAPPKGARQGKNSWGSVGYRGPAPPKGHGVHHYHFTLYALDAALPLEPELEKDELLKALNGHVLAQGKLIATYQR